MNTSRLYVRLLVAMLVATTSSFVVLALLTPGVLLLEPGVATAALVESAWTFPAILILSTIMTTLRVRRFGPALRALELGEGDVPGVDSTFIRRLHALPLVWVLWLAGFGIGVWCLTMFPPLRPSLIDAQTQVSVVLLAITVIAATSLPLYVAARALIGQTMEAAPWRVVETAMREASPQPDDEWTAAAAPLPRRMTRWFRVRAHSRVRGRLANAVALAVAIVAFGSLLLVDAHVRALDARSRRDDAYALARGILESEGVGRDAVIRAADELGYQVTLLTPEAAQYEPGSGSYLAEGGVRIMRIKLDDAIAVIRFQPTSGGAPVEVYVFAGALAIAAAALIGRFIGRAISRDLYNASREVRMLGAGDVLRGATRVAGPARFDEVAELGLGVEAVAERFREFAQGRERMIDARESAQRMRDLFLASMSHDLRSPLNGILGFVALLQKHDLKAAQMESLNIIDRRGRELLELIENILDAAKIEAARMELARDWMTPAELLATAVRRGRELTLEKGSPGEVEVRGELQQGIGPMWVDGPRLTQAVINLVANAVKFCDRGVVRIRFSKAARDDQEGVRIDVEDQGRGIPEKELAQIFDAFRQPIRSRRHGGLGLGLTMTRALVELHGGTIDVASSPEHGSVFTLFVPLVQPESEAAPMRPFKMPTPVPGSRPPFVMFDRPPADRTSERMVSRTVHEDPTVQMPALEIPEPPEDMAATQKLPARQSDSRLPTLPILNPRKPPQKP